MQTTFISRTLYNLKRQYGRQVELYKYNTISNNLETGVKTVTKIKYTVSAAIVLTGKSMLKQIYTSTFMRGAREFAYGNFLSTDDRFFIIDGKDIPNDIEFKYIVYEHKRYEVESMQYYEDIEAYFIKGKRTKGIETGEIHTLLINQRFELGQRLYNEP